MTDDTPRDERGLDPVPYLEAVALVLVAGLVISFGFTTPGRSWVVVVGTLAGFVIASGLTLQTEMQLFQLPARTMSGIGQPFLQTLFGHRLRTVSTEPR